jgi:hypothetical protein
VSEKQLLGGDAFEDPYDLANVVLGMKAEQYMNVILVITELLNIQVVPLFNTLHDIPHGGNYFRTQQGLSILQREDEVVMGVVNTVVALGDRHSISIAAYEGNLRFPSYSSPHRNPVAETTGKRVDFNLLLHELAAL